MNFFRIWQEKSTSAFRADGATSGKQRTFKGWVCRYDPEPNELYFANIAKTQPVSPT